MNEQKYTKTTKCRAIKSRGWKHERATATNDSDEREAKVPRKEDTSEEDEEDDTKVLPDTQTWHRKDGRAYVQKNSLNEEELIQARDQAKAKLVEKSGDEVTQEDVEEERRAANRLSAFQSRQRRKGIITGLEQVVKDLTVASAEKSKTIQNQKVKIESLDGDNARLREEISRQDDEILALKQALSLSRDAAHQLQKQQLHHQPNWKQVQNLLHNELVALVNQQAKAQPAGASLITASTTSRYPFPSAITTVNGAIIPTPQQDRSFTAGRDHILTYLQSQQHMVKQTHVSPLNTSMLNNQQAMTNDNNNQLIPFPPSLMSESSLLAFLRSKRGSHSK